MDALDTLQAITAVINEWTSRYSAVDEHTLLNEIYEILEDWTD